MSSVVSCLLRVFAAFDAPSDDADGAWQIYAYPSLDTDPPSYCTLFHHMVKSGGTSIRNQLVLASEAQERQTPGRCVVPRLIAGAQGFLALVCSVMMSFFFVQGASVILANNDTYTTFLVFFSFVELWFKLYY